MGLIVPGLVIRLKKISLFLILTNLVVSLVGCAIHGDQHESYHSSVQSYALIALQSTRIIHQNHRRGAKFTGIDIKLVKDELLHREVSDGRASGHDKIIQDYYYSYVETEDARLARPVRTSIDYADWVGYDYNYPPFSNNPFAFDRRPDQRTYALPAPLDNQVGSVLAAGPFESRPGSNGLTYFLKSIGMGVYSNGWEEQLKVAPVGLGYYPVESDGTSGYFKGFYPSFDLVNGSPVSRLDQYGGKTLPFDLKIEVEGRPDSNNLANVNGIIRVDIILGTTIQQSFKYGEFMIQDWDSENRKLDFEIYSSPRSL